MSDLVVVISVSFLVALIVCSIAIFIYLSRLKKNNKLIKQSVPIEVIKDFEEAERRFEQSNGEKDPNTILWEISNEKRKHRAERAEFRRANDSSVVSAKSTNETPKLHGELERRQSIQDGNTGNIVTNDRSIKQVKSNDGNDKQEGSRSRTRNFWGRFGKGN